MKNKSNGCSPISVAASTKFDCSYRPPLISFTDFNAGNFKEGAIITSDDGRKFEILNIDGFHVALKQVPNSPETPPSPAEQS
jgi:hypothetical protein